jgi:nucleotide-binding universal stress UspA family protein
MEWGRITVPLTGTQRDEAVLSVAGDAAQLFGAQLEGLYVPPDPAELTPWLGEGFAGSIQVAALDSLREAAELGLKDAEARFATLPGTVRGELRNLHSPVWQDLARSVRLADLVIFGDEPARGQGALAEAFQQVLMEERAAVFVARTPVNFKGPVVVAWDGGEPASRAARRAVPLLRHASEVIIAGAPVGDRPAELGRLQAYYALRGISATVLALPRTGDVAAVLDTVCRDYKAEYLVAGAFGRSRLHEFVFGGTTRALLNGAGPSLFMAH